MVASVRRMTHAQTLEIYEYTIRFLSKIVGLRDALEPARNAALAVGASPQVLEAVIREARI